MNSGKQVQHIKICGQNKECCTCMVVTAVVSSVANLPPLCVCVCVCVGMCGRKHGLYVVRYVIL